MQGRFVSYIRVSSKQQGASGLGLEAQQEAVARHLGGGTFTLVGEFVEVETGKGSNALSRRPQLKEALALAKKSKATLIIAKLDRLARNVHFISGLMETGVPFVAADMPTADRFQLHLYAALAEKEAEEISKRTKDALAAAKRKGKILGRHGAVLAAQNKADAVARLAPHRERLAALQKAGLSIRAMAATLNDEGVESPGGGRWHIATVQRAVGRLHPIVA